LDDVSDVYARILPLQESPQAADPLGMRLDPEVVTQNKDRALLPDHLAQEEASRFARHEVVYPGVSQTPGGRQIRDNRDDCHARRSDRVDGLNNDLVFGRVDNDRVAGRGLQPSRDMSRLVIREQCSLHNDRTVEAPADVFEGFSHPSYEGQLAPIEQDLDAKSHVM
jgi:hypothetical protein